MQDRKITMEEFKGAAPVKFDLVKMREALDNFRAMVDILKENAKLQASVTKAKYDALVAEGFTEQQAIELCKGNP